MFVQVKGGPASFDAALEAAAAEQVMGGLFKAQDALGADAGVAPNRTTNPADLVGRCGPDHGDQVCPCGGAEQYCR